MDGSNKAQALEESRAGNDPRWGWGMHEAWADCALPSQPDSPINVDCDPDTTPTKPNTASSIPIPIPFSSSEEVMMMDYFMSPRSRASSTASTASSAFGGGSGNGSSGVSASAVAPRLRRRRSSLSIAASNGLSAVKSPQRNAGMALQRSTFMGPIAGRARSGSIDVGPIGLSRGFGNGVGGDEGNGVPVVQSNARLLGSVGRSRSGSMGGALRSRRVALRKPPSVPPPNMPLPPLPNSNSPLPLPIMTDAFAVPRRPLVSRAHTVENVTTPGEATSSFLAPAPPLPSLPLDLRNNLKASISTGTPPSPNPLAELAAFWAPGARMNEN
ncbi:hypothetical protein B0F90DRAFT_1670046 [Multifurca ochricompacta]|uniref:Uncharacterized protein n=1 Tax=Multifurca ochricompacta TaxID=376703 RepID=A0AAD4LZ00_9AGAM|nr:hypothetical protein B0F90DRAFT_1670046 [Multifurca ochricompacta]